MIQEDTKKTVLQTIEQSDKPITITEIAEQTGITRQTISKYVTVLEAAGAIYIAKEVGNAVLFDTKEPEFQKASNIERDN